MRILFVTTVSGTINAFLIPHIEMLLKKGHEVDIACKLTIPINNILQDKGCTIYNIPFQRSPFTKENYKAYKQLQQLIKQNQYGLVHTHTPVASTCVRLACRKMGNVKVFYTAHGFHFFKGAPIKNWLFYYPIEKWLAKYTDTLITINKEDYERAKNKFKAKRVEYIPGVGLDIDKFRNVVVDKTAKRKEIGVPQNSFIVLSVGELNKNKNHEVVIRAIAKLNNPDIHYMICGKGPLEIYLKKLAKKLGIEKQVHLLGFRKDIAEICKVSDVFAFPSKREGLGLAALEAMACGLPLVTSNIHGILDYSDNNKTGYACNPMDIDGFKGAIETLRTNETLMAKVIENNSRVIKKFNIELSINRLKNIYGDIINYGEYRS